MSKIKRFIEEEVNEYMNKFNIESPKQVAGILNELFHMNTNKLMDNIGSVESDGRSEVAAENWDLLIDSITQSIQEDPDTWLIGLTSVKNKIITYKYFTKQDLIAPESLEGHLRVEIKPYFTALQNYSTEKDFLNRFFNLPARILFNMVRYIFLVNLELKDSIVVTNQDLKDNINRVMELRLKIADGISKVSKGYSEILDIGAIKEGFDNGVFFEDNFLNRGICEFVVKLTNHKKAKSKMLDMFSGVMVNDINEQAVASAAYIAHIAGIRQEIDYEYFTVNGEQVGKKFDNELSTVVKGNYEGYVVDRKSRLKEPNNKINTGIMPWEDKNSMPGGAGGGTGGSGGDGFGGAAGAGGGPGGSGGFGGDLGNADFGGDFAPPGAEGEIPGAVDPGTVEDDGTPMPDDEDGLPADFGTVEDNTEESPEPEKPQKEEKKDGEK